MDFSIGFTETGYVCTIMAFTAIICVYLVWGRK